MAFKGPRRSQPRHPAATMSTPAKGRRPADEPRPHGLVDWACALVLVGALAWWSAFVATELEAGRALVALGVGAALVVALRHRAWGPDWRSGTGASRACRRR